MKKLLFIALALLGANGAYAQASEDFTSLITLVGGNWQMTTDKGVVIGENWKVVNNNEYKGRGFKVVGKDTTNTENITLAKRGEDIFYAVQQPGEQETVYFKLTDSRKKKFIFHAPEHDYPQRIVYQFKSDDVLEAWIDGQKDGKYLKQKFDYKRVYNKN